MKFYYTILKISPNTSSGDTISIGLLAFNEKQAVISFSESRKLLAKKMVNPDLVEFFCKQMISKVAELNKTHQSQLSSLFKNDFVFDASYIDYISNYSNGLLQLSKSNLFLKPLDEHTFNLLFETLIDKLEIKKSQKRKSTSFNKLVDEKLIDKVKDKVHTNIKIDSSLIPNLYFSYDMECIGKNGSFVGAKVIDFSNKKQTLDNTISHYSSLIAILSANNKKDISKNKFYLISEEPDQRNSPEYGLWDSIQNNPLFKVIHPEESGVVAEDIQLSKATKFLS